MDNQRLLIWAFFGLMAWITYQTWVQDYAPRPTPVQAPISSETPGLEAPVDDDLPELTAAGVGETDQAPTLVDEAAIDAAVSTQPVIRVTTDVLDLQISTEGGTITSAKLPAYPVAKDNPDTKVQLLSTDSSNFGRVQTGLIFAGDGEEANHNASFSADAMSYDIGASDELVVNLAWQGADGVSVEKRYRFERGSYKIDVKQTVTNGSTERWRGAAYAQIQRHSGEQERSMFDVDSYSFSGPIVYDGEKSEKLKHDDLTDDGNYTFKSQAGWLGAIEHHFLSALVPEPGTEQSYSVAVRGDRSTARFVGAAEVVNPGASKTFSTTAFVGPKLQAQLEEIDESLKLTVDYGWLTIISQPLFWLLSFVYDYVSNWGVAIIIVTFLIKLVFYKLTESSGRSMAKMRNLQPRMKALQDRYKDDKQALSAAMMELYKREKVNPAAGCLPILIQMPFFLAFYWVLLESVEMRQAPFALWITDLSTKDPYFILPLIMGAAMFMQQKLNPAPADPVQAKVMQIMPIMFTAFFAFFPSGLVLYWVTNTLLSIAQQWKINKVVEAEAKVAKGGKKKQKDAE